MAKVGEGSLMAWLRLGLAEARQIFSLGGNIEQPTPYGMFGTQTPGEIADARRDKPERAAAEGLPLPSDVLDNPKAYLPEQGHENDHRHDHSNDHGREL